VGIMGMFDYLIKKGVEDGVKDLGTGQIFDACLDDLVRTCMRNTLKIYKVHVDNIREAFVEKFELAISSGCMSDIEEVLNEWEEFDYTIGGNI
jgi:hypothetical protein